MRRSRLAVVFVCVSVAAAAFAVSVSGSHGTQRWSGTWSVPSWAGGIRLLHRDDGTGAFLLEQIGGLACPEPTDYFTGTWWSDYEVLPGTLAGCTVGDPDHLSGRYRSDSNAWDALRGDFELILDEVGESWVGTYTVDGDPNEYAWSGIFEEHDEWDGAGDPSVPPYGNTGPGEGDPGGSGNPPPAEDPLECFGRDATITPNPDAPAGLAISGTASDDVIVGTPGDDRILGLGGNDTICGFGGDDELIGADDDDTILGGAGDDVLDGGAGSDSLHGEADDDELLGGAGTGYLEGGAGNDRLVGGEGRDLLYGGLNLLPESAVEGADDDVLLGDAGNDVLDGGRGRDTLTAGAGDDILRGGSGNDSLKGEKGTDRLDGGGGNDSVDGGNGGEHAYGDMFGDLATYVEATGGVQLNLVAGRVTGGLGRDSIREIESVIGSRWDDVLRGSGRPDWLAGDAGADFLYGLRGGDELFGGTGDDTLFGGPDRDTAYGSSGFDRCAAERRSGCERLLVGPGAGAG